MKVAKFHLWIIAGSAVVMIAVLLGISTLPPKSEDKQAHPHDRTQQLQRRTTSLYSGESKAKPPRPKSVRNPETYQQLTDLVRKDDMHTIHESLTELAQAGRLGEISDLLHEWCRGENLELAQWSLLLSAESDTALHVKLCADALSHSSDAIRESARVQLEAISGKRFEDSTQAFLWLAQQSPEKK